MEKDLCKIEPYDGIIMCKHPDNIPQNKIDYCICETFIPFYFQWGLYAYNISSKKMCEEMINIKCIDMPIDNFLYHNIFSKYNVVFTTNDPFINLGYLAGNKVREYKFKSLIYG